LDTHEIISAELKTAAAVLNEFTSNSKNIDAIAEAARIISQSLKQGGKVMSCGNGGSHCDAMHFAEELTGRYREERKPLAALAISDPTHISCVGNDYGFDLIFSRFIEAHGRKGDTLFCLSTSGNSRNILLAADMARDMGFQVIALTGKDGGQLAGKADLEIRVPYTGYADRIQEIHIKIIHILILLIEKELT